MEIRKLEPAEIIEAIQLIWETFLEFDAPDFSQQGVDTFRQFIADPDFTKTCEFFAVFDHGLMKGVLATRDKRRHISCFFVKAPYQRQGLGKKLWEYLKANSNTKVFTVNSSPYAVPFYHKLGFADTNGEQLTDGIRYTPMIY